MRLFGCTGNRHNKLLCCSISGQISALLVFSQATTRWSHINQSWNLLVSFYSNDFSPTETLPVQFLGSSMLQLFPWCYSTHGTAKSLLTGLSAFICPEVSQHLSTCELNPAVFTRGEIEGQRKRGREKGGRTPEHRIYRTGGDVKLEVRNNWCNAGKWRRGSAGG